MSGSLLPCRCVVCASRFRSTVYDRAPFQRIERRVESEGGSLICTELFIYFHSHADFFWQDWGRADRRRLPVAFLTRRLWQNALFCSLLIMGHSNKMLLKMGVGKVLRTEVRLLSLTVFLLEKNISLFHNLGVSKNSHFELLLPHPRCGYACLR